MPDVYNSPTCRKYRSNKFGASGQCFRPGGCRPGQFPVRIWLSIGSMDFSFGEFRHITSSEAWHPGRTVEKSPKLLTGKGFFLDGPFWQKLHESILLRERPGMEKPQKKCQTKVSSPNRLGGRPERAPTIGRIRSIPAPSTSDLPNWGTSVPIRGGLNSFCRGFS